MVEGECKLVHHIAHLRHLAALVDTTSKSALDLAKCAVVVVSHDADTFHGLVLAHRQPEWPALKALYLWRKNETVNVTEYIRQLKNSKNLRETRPANGGCQVSLAELLSLFCTIMGNVCRLSTALLVHPRPAKRLAHPREMATYERASVWSHVRLQDFVAGWIGMSRQWQLRFLQANPDLFKDLFVEIDNDTMGKHVSVDTDALMLVWLRMAWAKSTTALRQVPRPGGNGEVGLPSSPPTTYSSASAALLREMQVKKLGTERGAFPNDDHLRHHVASVKWALEYAQVGDHNVVQPQPDAYREEKGVVFRVLSDTLAIGPAGIRARATHITHVKGKGPSRSAGLLGHEREGDLVALAALLT